ncbi:cytochrome P450 [Actinomadura sp. ATCC 31491]|uniref:Cytochrome P450 n=1 Tax=Actinomadura luzonensis TaxID=2805427 RepID=A0ABT0FV65_9ACTN|nr:cytochrome P450 [Actinomadura luzonensis]MCK2215803.1 cytochrome P450 [Actinomadura luzonensis]
MERLGGTRTMGRMYAWLMICDPPHRSLTELAADLGVSKTATSTVARRLESAGMVERVPAPGREHRYRVVHGGWEHVLRVQLAGVRLGVEALDFGLSVLPGDRAEQRARLRETRDLFAFTEYDGVLADPGTYSSDTVRLLPPGVLPEELSMEGFITQIDPPAHGKLRKLVSSAFTRKVVADLEPRIAALTQELLDAARERGRLELVADLAHPLPVIVIAELLGVPVGDRELFKRWADALFERDAQLSVTDTGLERQALVESSTRAWREMAAYLGGHAAERRRRPRADLLTRLVEAEVDGERLPDVQVVNFAMVLLLAGHITTTMLLGNTVLCLDALPGQQERARADRATVPAVIEESLRLLTPFAAVARSTTRESELGGVTIPADSYVMVWLAAANRDPRAFPGPETFDPGRDPNPHLAFGRGIHFCLGAPLARLEERVAPGILLDRINPIRTDPEDPVLFIPTPTMTGVRRLPLTWPPPPPAT